jgi:asparagine synthase (glutamine-hydrolysing)
VIVHLYEDHGDACVEHLRGMFAFALWDRRRRRLLVARDRLGKKPLFYAQTGDGLWFGSEAKAILQDRSVPRDPDWQAIDAFLHYRYVPDPQSAFSALRKLPPAHLLICEDGRVSVRRYWKLSYEDRLGDLAEPELGELIRARLLEATELRLRSDVPVGAFLSGGIDSSSVVAAMARLTNGPVRTFSVGFDVSDFDETAHAREVAELYETDHHELRLDAAAMEVLPRLVWHYGEPFADQSAIPSLHVAELARPHVTVALSGDGGDESFGYPRYTGLAPTDSPGNGRSTLRAWAERLAQGISRSSSPGALGTRLGRRLQPLPRAPLERYARRIAYWRDADRVELYEPEFLASLGERSWFSVLDGPYQTSDADNVVERLMDVDVRSNLPGALLVKMDIASMAHSLEVRSPLLDQRFMETAAALPIGLKLEGTTTKRIFKEALRPWLPDVILEREKMGFGVPIGEWFRRELRDLPPDMLLDARSLGRGLFREEAVRKVIEDHRAGASDNANKIWALLQLELWLRTHVDEVPSESPPAAMPVT